MKSDERIAVPVQMSSVWMQTRENGLARADEIIGIEAYGRDLMVRLRSLRGQSITVTRLPKRQEAQDMARRLGAALTHHLAEGTPGRIVVEADTIRFDPFRNT